MGREGRFSDDGGKIEWWKEREMSNNPPMFFIVDGGSCEVMWLSRGFWFLAMNGGLEFLVSGWPVEDTMRAIEQGEVGNGIESEDDNEEQYDEDDKFDSEDGNEAQYDEDDERWEELGRELDEADEEELEEYISRVQPEIDLMLKEEGFSEGWNEYDAWRWDNEEIYENNQDIDEGIESRTNGEQDGIMEEDNIVTPWGDNIVTPWGCRLRMVQEGDITLWVDELEEIRRKEARPIINHEELRAMRNKEKKIRRQAERKARTTERDMMGREEDRTRTVEEMERRIAKQRERVIAVVLPAVSETNNDNEEGEEVEKNVTKLALSMRFETRRRNGLKDIEEQGSRAKKVQAKIKKTMGRQERGHGDRIQRERDWNQRVAKERGFTGPRGPLWEAGRNNGLSEVDGDIDCEECLNEEEKNNRDGDERGVYAKIDDLCIENRRREGELDGLTVYWELKKG